MKFELDLNEVEIAMIKEVLKDKGNENTVSRMWCNGIIRHIDEQVSKVQ